MPISEEITKKEQAEIDSALAAYLKENKEISDAIDVMKQAASVRNCGRYSIEPGPYRSVRSEQ